MAGGTNRSQQKKKDEKAKKGTVDHPGKELVFNARFTKKQFFDFFRAGAKNRVTDKEVQQQLVEFQQPIGKVNAPDEVQELIYAKKNFFGGASLKNCIIITISS